MGDALAHVRACCLELPEASEKEAWGDPTFRIRDRIFAMVKSGDGRPSLWLKGAPGQQEMLIEADPRLYYRPPYVGHKGWIGIRLDVECGPEEIRGRIRQSFVLVAPKKLASAVE